MDEFVEKTGVVPYTGDEPGKIVGIQSGPFFEYDVAILRNLLAFQTPKIKNEEVKGIRFHFNQERPIFPTILYAAACGTEKDLVKNFFDSEGYFLSNGETESRINLPDPVGLNFAKNSGKPAGSAFFSKTILEQPTMLGPASSPSTTSKIRFYVKDAGPDCHDSRDIPCFTLVAIGVDAGGMLTGPFIMSEQPCPPNCPTGDE